LASDFEPEEEMMKSLNHRHDRANEMFVYAYLIPIRVHHRNIIAQIS
jgi:hypothetical protein